MSELEPTRTSSDLTATERLRRMLDERGVEWWPLGSDMTECVVNGVRIKYRQVGRGLIVSTCIEGTVTPEQAIAATLGAGTCHDEGDPSDFCCSECGMRMFTEANDTYTMIAADERTIIKRPNYCPNCGRKVVDE
jgi:DNA-directed RNA polymerase subunit RPC12/RpoP